MDQSLAPSCQGCDVGQGSSLQSWANFWSKSADSYQPAPPPALPPAGGMKPSVLKGGLGGRPQHPLQYPTDIHIEMEIGKYFRR